MNTRTSTTNTMPKRREAGFYMIEVLVSVLILAVGLLGLAALQSRSLQYNHDGYLRSQATVLANDIVERMRAGRASLSPTQRPDAYAVASGTTTGNCNPAQITAESDVRCWQAAVANQLPGGACSITQNGGDPETYDVVVSWTHREGGTRNITWNVRP